MGETHETVVKVKADVEGREDVQGLTDDLNKMGAAAEGASQKATKAADKAVDTSDKKAVEKAKTWLQRLMGRIGDLTGSAMTAAVKSGSASPLGTLPADIMVAGTEEAGKDVKTGALKGGLAKTLVGVAKYGALALAAGTGMGLSKQAALSQRVGQLESSLAFAELSGVGPKGGLLGPEGAAWRMRQAKMGYTPEQGVEMARQYAGALGYKRTGSETDYGKLALSGVGVGAVGGYESVNAPGRNVSGGNVERVLGIAFAQGFRGAGLDRMLGAMQGLLTDIGAHGVRVEAGAFEKFMGRMHGTPGLQDVGEAGVGAMKALTQPGLDTREQMLSPYRSIANAMVKARIMSGGGGIKGIIGRAEQFAGDPDLALQALKQSGLDRETLGLAVTGMTGLTQDRARAMMSLGAADYGGLEQVDPNSRARTRVLAEREARTIGRVEAVDAYEMQMNAAEALESVALKLGEVTAGLMKVVGDLL